MDELVNFDAKLYKHNLVVMYSEEIRKLFDKTSTKMRPIVNNIDSSSRDSGTLSQRFSENPI